MIFKDHLGYDSVINENVEIFNRNKVLLGKGKLYLSKDKIPYIEILGMSNPLKIKTYSILIIVTKNYKSFTLLGFKVDNWSIFPKAIIEGNKLSNKFKNVSILFQGLSEWIDDKSRFEYDFNKKKVTRDLCLKSFKAKIFDGEKTFTISNETWFDSEHLKPNSQKINVYSMINLKCINGSWDLEGLFVVIKELRTFLTLMTGHTVGIDYIVDDARKKGNFIYYPYGSRSDGKKDWSYLHCFVESNYLFKENRWQNLLQNYFDIDKKELRETWSKIAGMLCFEGFWEYLVLGYVSLLDKYISIYAKGLDYSISDRNMSKIRKKFREILEDEIVNDDSPDDVLKSVIESLKNQVSLLKNSSHSTFGQKFELIKKEDKDTNDIIEILGFNENHFKDIKRVRDSIAHGGIAKIKSKGNLYYESSVTNKIALLLRFWTFRDLGVDLKSFLGFIDNFLYGMNQMAYINHSKLAKRHGKYLFLKINSENMRKAKKHQSSMPIAFNFIKGGSSLEFNLETTRFIENWAIEDNRHKSFSKYLKEGINVINFKNFSHVGVLFLECGDDVYKINSACIFNIPNHLCIDSRITEGLCVFDEKTQSWGLSILENRLKKLTNHEIKI